MRGETPHVVHLFLNKIFTVTAKAIAKDTAKLPVISTSLLSILSPLSLTSSNKYPTLLSTPPPITSPYKHFLSTPYKHPLKTHQNYLRQQTKNYIITYFFNTISSKNHPKITLFFINFKPKIILF